jgi:uncharacterized protein (TIGR04222 family)
MLSFLDLPGPDFLNLYGLVTILVLGAAWLLIHSADRTPLPPPPVPEKPDPIEVAFLQGGVNQVVRTVVYDLVQRGHAALIGDDRVAPTANAPQPGELDALETRVLSFLKEKPRAHRLFDDRAERAALLDLLAPVRARLSAQQLIKPQAVKLWRRRVQIGGALMLTAVAGPKIYRALVEGSASVSYLVFLWIASILALLALAYVATRSHASRRGRAWLEAMALAYRPRLDQALAALGASHGMRGFDGAALFLIGLYGFSVLKGTPDAAFAEHFGRASHDGAGSCGASCSGSCGDGSGD